MPKHNWSGHRIVGLPGTDRHFEQKHFPCNQWVAVYNGEWDKAKRDHLKVCPKAKHRYKPHLGNDWSAGPGCIVCGRAENVHPCGVLS